MFDKVKDDSSQKMFTAIFHAKNRNLSKTTKSTGFARTFQMFDSRRLLGYKQIKHGGNSKGDVMMGGGLNNEYFPKKALNLLKC